MDDLLPDIGFVLLEERGGEEYIGTSFDIVLGADILFCGDLLGLRSIVSPHEVQKA